MNSFNYGVSADQIENIVLAKKALHQAEQSVTDTALKHIGINKGDTVEDIYSGYHYEVSSAVVHTSTGRVSISILGYRVWRTGRKAGKRAYSTTFLNMTDVKKVETNDKE